MRFLVFGGVSVSRHCWCIQTTSGHQIKKSTVWTTFSHSPGPNAFWHSPDPALQWKTPRNHCKL